MALSAEHLRTMLERCQERWPDVRCTFGQIAFWSAHIGRDGEDVRIDEAAWGYRIGGELEYDGDRDAIDAILEWARPEGVLTTLDDAAVLARHGLSHDPAAPWMKENARSLDEIDKPRVPRGYRLTTMADYVDTSSRSAAHRSAFAPGSQFTDDVYATVRATRPYRSELDCVCVAPDGSVASYTLAWLDESNEIGELEPVGTHAEHRRLGLARATNLFALRRLRDEGAKTALVACRADDAYPPASCALYESIGFRERRRLVTFTARD